MRSLVLPIPGLSARSCDLPLPKEVQEKYASWLPRKWQTAVEKRKIQSMGARWCAVEAARALGISLASLPLDEAGAPIWPVGLMGSLAHTETRAVAVVSTTHTRVGVDVEDLFDKSKLELLTDTILTAQEKKYLAPHDSAERCWQVTSIFSLKEAAYKALYPQLKTFIDFPELEVNLTSHEITHISGQRLRAHLLRETDHVISVVYG